MRTLATILLQTKWLLFRGVGIVVSVVAFLPAPSFSDTENPFPSGLSNQVRSRALQALSRVPGESGVGQSVASEFSEVPSSGKFKEHPWLNGRNVVDSQLDWIKDSQNILGIPEGALGGAASAAAEGGLVGSPDFQRFMRCIEPRPILGFESGSPLGCPHCAPKYFRPDPEGNSGSCPVKRNAGFLFAYWWPEAIVEVNQFGISAYNPLVDAETTREILLQHPILLRALQFGSFAAGSGLSQALGGPVDRYLGKYPETKSATAKFPPGFRDPPNAGFTATAGILPGDQNVHLEAHVYQTSVAKKSSEARKPTGGRMGNRWHEVKIFGITYCYTTPFWYNGYEHGNRDCFYSTTPEDSPVVNMWTEEALYAPYWRIPELSKNIDSSLYNQMYFGFDFARGDMFEQIADKGKGYIQAGTCSSYRAATWPQRYKDLVTSFNVVPRAIPSGERLCYRGGGDLFPIVGTISSLFTPAVSAAYLTRRALFLSSPRVLNAPNPTNKFSDRADKLQRVAPDVSECFRMNDVDEFNTGLFPADLIRPEFDEHNKSIRYVYWNMRVACVCERRGLYPLPWYLALIGGDALGPFQVGWGCSPFNGSEQSKGQLADQSIEGEDPPPLFPTAWPLSVGGAEVDYTKAMRQLYPFEHY